MAIFVSILALVFTITSFWWLNVRRGSLRAGVPAFFAFAGTPQRLRVRLPLVIHNTGAASIIVDDLRLVVDSHVLRWITVRRSVRPEKDDLVDFASSVHVAGRQSLRFFAEFGEDPSPWHPEPGRCYKLRIDRQVNTSWKPLLAFDWWAPKENMNRYVAHRNTSEGGPPPPDQPPPGETFATDSP